MKTSIALWALLLGVAHAETRFCKKDGYKLDRAGYSYCYSSNWFGDHIDPFAAKAGNSNADWDSNWIYAPENDPHKKNPTLLLFLAGHGENVSDYTQFMRKAQELGYYVIGLAYQNGESLQSLCGTFADCYDKLLAQNVYLATDNHFYSKLAGAPTHYDISDNSINHRLDKLLSKLESEHIAGGFKWTQFYDSNAHEVEWHRIVVAGHSEGGATAAWITRNKPVIAGLTFEAPYSMLAAKYDQNGTLVAAPTESSDFTPYADKKPVPPASNTSPVPYLQCAQPSDCDWAKKLHITLQSYDTGYDNKIDTFKYSKSKGTPLCKASDSQCTGDQCTCKLPNWGGVNMERAAYTLKPKQEISMDATSVPTASTIANHTWYTSTEVPTLCEGHHATVNDDCVPDWIKTYWTVLLGAVLPKQ